MDIDLQRIGRIVRSAFLVLCWVGLLAALSGRTAWADSQEDAFLAAREAYRAHDQARLDDLAKDLKGYLLYPYVAYWDLQLRLDQASPEEVRAFLAANRDTPLADRLRGEWLKELGKNQEWSLFLSEYPFLVKGDKTLTCYALQARLAAGDKGVLPQVEALWMDGSDLPANCTPLFDALAARHQLTQHAIWARIRLALEAGNVNVAEAAAAYLPRKGGLTRRDLRRAADHPERYLDRSRHHFRSRAVRELVLFALQRIARNQPDLAQYYWDKLRRHFGAADRSYLWGRLAYYAARKHDPVALKWFREAGDGHLTEVQLAWKARAALRAQDWPEVLAAIDAMPQAERERDSWRYWKARALREQGKVAAANAILAPLSGERGFYGQLAGEDLGQVAASPPRSYTPTEQEIAAVQALPGIRRALALYRLGLRGDAVREWVWAIRGMGDEQLLAAAELARRNGWYDRAINTADKTVRLHDFRLSFLAPYREVMQNYTSQLDLDEAWVYGLIRQESRFVPHARSSAGAAGVMQLMPSTARWVARRLGLKDYRRALAGELDTNIALGTYYLKHVMTLLDGSPLLATAGYNAGPLRAKRWRDDKAMEGAVYAESIPFSETRDYVKKVMSNAAYYARRFGQKLVSLKDRLGTVGGKDEDNPDGDSAAGE